LLIRLLFTFMSSWF